MSRALILGGTGAIGRATAHRLLGAGWQVDLTGRDPAHMPAALTAAGARFAVADRADPGRLTAILGDGADLLVDCVCFTAADAAALLPLAAPTRTRRAGSRSPARSPGNSAMAGTRCCSATTPRPGWAGTPGTRGRRSCWT